MMRLLCSGIKIFSSVKDRRWQDPVLRSCVDRPVDAAALETALRHSLPCELRHPVGVVVLDVSKTGA